MNKRGQKYNNNQVRQDVKIKIQNILEDHCYIKLNYNLIDNIEITIYKNISLKKI